MAGRRRRGRGRKAAIFAAVAALHGLIFLQITRDLRLPSMKGDGSGQVVALQVTLAASTILEDPRSQGADEATQALAEALPAAPPAEHETQAAGAGAEPQILEGGSHADSHAKEAPVARAGGGGGSQDDPYARASLTPAADAQGAFDIAARNAALFLSRVAPCLKTPPLALAGVEVAVTLGDDGQVLAAAPTRPGVSSEAVLVPTRAEAQAISALKACAPYHDLVLGRSPVLKLPAPAGLANSSAPEPIKLALHSAPG